MIVIAGKNNIAVRAIDYLIRNGEKEIAVVCNQTDKGVDGWQKSLYKFAKLKGIDIIDLNAAYTISDIFISLEFDRIVAPEKFKNQKLYNVHFSNLPKYKGMYTSVFPILNNENAAGVTLHEIDPGIDTGNIVNSIEFKIKPSYRARDLYRLYLEKGLELFINNIKRIQSEAVAVKKQDWINSTYYSKNAIDFANLRVDLIQTAAGIRRQIYAYSFREYQLPYIYKRPIVEATVLDKRSLKKPGTIIKENESSIIITTIDYDLELFFDKIDSVMRFSNCNVTEVPNLLKNLAGINDRNDRGWSPIIIAAYNGNYEVVEFLLEAGALENDENYNGTTALMYAKEYALRSGDKRIFDTLIDHGADTEKVDFFGKNIRDYLTTAEEKFLGL